MPLTAVSQLAGCFFLPAITTPEQAAEASVCPGSVLRAAFPGATMGSGGLGMTSSFCEPPSPLFCLKTQRPTRAPGVCSECGWL